MAKVLTFEITYNANGGSGAPATTTVRGSYEADEFPVLLVAAVSAGVPSRVGYKFLGWARTAGGSAIYHGGQNATHTFQYSDANSYTLALYAVWQEKYVYLSFNANGGSGAPSMQTRLKNVSSKLPTTVPTRTGYKFVGWSFYSNGAGTVYKAGALCAISANTTMYAVWAEKGSSAFVSPSRIPIDGSTVGTITLTKSTSSIDHHTVIVKLGNSEQTFTNVDLSQTFTLPLSWNNEIPNLAETSVKVIVHSYLSNDTEWGSGEEYTFTAYVPETIVPSVSITIEQMGNALAKTWGIYIQQYSSVKFSVSASGQYSATITKIEITGPGISASASGSSLETTSSVFAGYGEMQYAIIAYDSRGRSKTETRTITVEQYFRPVLVGLEAFRSTQQSAPDDVEGAYITTKFTGINCSASSENDVVVEIKYKLEDASSYTDISNNAVANYNYVVSADVTKSYLVYVKATDEFGNYTETVFRIGNIVCSLALGLNNDRARFGGPCRKAGLEVDWKAWFDDDIDVLGDSEFHGDVDVQGGLNYLGHEMFKSLWSDSSGWSTGDITVDGISDYRIFLIRMSGQGTVILATLGAGDLVDDPTYFRGMGGYASGASAELRYFLSATLSGDTLTMQYCRSVDQSNKRTDRTVIEIIGVI